MFTGIIEELGEITELSWKGEGAVLAVRGPIVASDARHGDSIAVNGVCLTVVTTDGESFTVDVMKESFDRSSLAQLTPGSRVNLERAAKVGDRLGGHIVQGHVDGVATITAREPGDLWEIVRFTLPPDLARYAVEKGSITVDGISLTITEISADHFSVSLIPTTLEVTTLGRKAVGDLVNIEVDVVAKYVERLVTPHTDRLAGGAR
ncbi:riboflavin synthase [Allocatelliglobosispora scoriae]|uniref:Riboflavin synthase n=1 Tax=Allocatelliglobosispora scoriae TaxID=643052 RepID=A0A841C2U0_9ACTN|nr:riboflavin synthase [Allocatelliglobosispora scoriae]MBB5873161.1 riboflavin synthase [Allocatelliglobosispora scoriae]